MESIRNSTEYKRNLGRREGIYPAGGDLMMILLRV